MIDGIPTQGARAYLGEGSVGITGRASASGSEYRVTEGGTSSDGSLDTSEKEERPKQDEIDSRNH